MGLSNCLRVVHRKFLEVFKRRAPVGSEAAKEYSDFTRFIFEKRHFSVNPQKARPGAFLPDSDLKTSAVGKNGFTEEQLWNFGVLIGQERNKSPKARADFDAQVVAEAKLTIENDPQPSIPSHINLGGWPTEKDEQKNIAVFLCAKAKLLLRTMSTSAPLETGNQQG